MKPAPPKDVGCVWGYTDFLEALADPNHEQRPNLLRWSRPFDSEAFDAQKATNRIRRGLPDRRKPPYVRRMTCNTA